MFRACLTPGWHEREVVRARTDPGVVVGIPGLAGVRVRDGGLAGRGDDDFDSLAEHLACLYDECEILPRPDRAVGSILRASEVPAMRMLGRQLGALILELGEAPDCFYLAHPRWFDVVVAAEGALAAMES